MKPIQIALLAGLLLLGCTKKESAPNVVINIDGSSTVFPITEAIAEEFGKSAAEVRVAIGVSGTGGGFKRFVVGDTDISNASRPIKPEEAELAKKNGVEYVEVPVAYDGLSVVVSKENTWVDHLTVEELKKIWSPESKVKTWKDVRASFPDTPIQLFGPGTDSGTFDYFTEVINGKSGVSRSDYSKSEDDNTLVNGVAGSAGALGYFGYAYYKENAGKLKVVPIVEKKGKAPVTPSEETIKDHSYSPLSRPVFIYVSLKALKRPEVEKFVNFFVETAPKLASEVGFVAMPDEKYQTARENIRAAGIKM